MTKSNISNFIIFLVFLLIVIMIFNLFNNTVTVIEEKEKEGYMTFPNFGLDANESAAVAPFFVRDLNNRYVVRPCPCGCSNSRNGCYCQPGCSKCKCRSVYDAQYYSETASGPTYRTGVGLSPGYGSKLGPSLGMKPEMFDTGIDWSMKYEPGTNNTVGDLVWNNVSPRMVLKDTTLDCRKWGPKSNYKPPSGFLSDVAGQYSNYGPSKLPGNEFPINGLQDTLSRKTIDTMGLPQNKCTQMNL